MKTASSLPARPVARPTLVLLAASLGVLVAQIDTSVVSLAVKRIGVDLGAGVSGMQWMIDAYNLVYAALLLTAGALGDLYGRRRVFMYGIALFAAGSSLCGLAPDTAVLLTGRALSGLGAALELPMSLVVLAQAYPEARARQHALGIWASCNGLAFIIGPTLGGLLVETAGWRSIFYVTLPLCAATLVLAQSAIEESSIPRGPSLDVPGQGAAVAALGGLAFAVIEGSRLGWRSAPVLVAGGLCLAGALAFALIERRSAHPLVPFALFRSRPFSAALTIAGCMTFGMYALLFLIPLYFQTVRGDGTLGAGLRMLPLSVAFVLVSRRNGAIVQRLGLRWTMAAGMTAMGAGEVVLGFLSAGAAGWLVATALCVVGLGLNTAPVNAVAIAHAPGERSGTASGLLNTARLVGATLGVAILGAVFARFAGQHADARSFLPGLRGALGVGGVIELAGAAVALRYIPRGHRPV